MLARGLPSVIEFDDNGTGRRGNRTRDDQPQSEDENPPFSPRFRTGVRANGRKQ
jgi:hypothetical protein